MISVIAADWECGEIVPILNMWYIMVIEIENQNLNFTSPPVPGIT